MRLVPLALVALVLIPAAAATAGPLFFNREYWWSGFATPGALDTQTFSVPATANLLCYARFTILNNSDHVAEFQATLKDGAGRLVVVDQGDVVDLHAYSLRRVAPTVPVLPFGNAFEPGTFTFQFQANGFHGDWRFQVYQVTAPSECGTLPP